MNAAHRDQRRFRTPGRRFWAAVGSVIAVAAAVVLYRGFTSVLEIPVGGLGILGWILIRRRRQAT